jgi:secreted trypsin-like serine protease
MKALVHENYNINNNYHYNDIGLVVLRSPARLGESVCTLCLPREGQTAGEGAECTVTGYGRPTAAPVRARGEAYWADTTTDGVLREAGLVIREQAVCRDHVLAETSSTVDMTSLLCAGGLGGEKACYVSSLVPGQPDPRPQVGMDGGSPLSCLHPSGHHYLAGIVSWGSACGQGAAPRSGPPGLLPSPLPPPLPSLSFLSSPSPPPYPPLLPTLPYPPLCYHSYPTLPSLFTRISDYVSWIRRSYRVIRPEANF